MYIPMITYLDRAIPSWRHLSEETLNKVLRDLGRQQCTATHRSWTCRGIPQVLYVNYDAVLFNTDRGWTSVRRYFSERYPEVNLASNRCIGIYFAHDPSALYPAEVILVED